MCKVVFLGAGASYDAGYPLTKELFSNMDSFYEDKLPSLKEAWASFKCFRELSEGLIKRLLDSNNPELVITALDLLHEADQENNAIKYKNFHDVIKNNNIDNQSIINDIFKISSYTAKKIDADKTDKIKRQFLIAFCNYFTYKDNEVISNLSNITQVDCKNETFNYVNNMLCRCDIVISTNWDTLAEFVLMKSNLWNPHDGYGFLTHLETGSHTTVHYSKSRIKILKLHGSIGWNEGNDKKEISLDKTYLSHLLIRPPNSISSFSTKRIPLIEQTIQDKNSKGPIWPQEQFLILPSYIKQLDNINLQSIWNQASDALQKADEVTFVGYSLPPADIGIRVLLNPLRQRLQRKRIFSKRVKITIVIGQKNKEIEKRWTNFLGEDIKIECKKAKDMNW